MKAEHRRELHTNLLADRLGKFVEGMKTAPRSTTSIVWTFILLAVVVFVVWQYYRKASAQATSALWTEVASATHSPETGMNRLRELAEQNASTLPGRAAAFQLARIELQRGQERLTSVDRNEAIQSLLHARDYYRTLAKESSDSPILLQEALMGMAKAEESLVGVTEANKPDQSLGSLDEALEHYRTLATKFPNGALGKEAAKRVEEIEKDRAGIERFYKELNELVNPKPLADTKKP